MNTTLMKSIVELAAFLSLGGDDVVQPDAAVAQLEQLAATLKEMSQEDRQAFVRYIDDLTQRERRAGKEKDRIAFLETLPENFGIEKF